MTVLEINPVTRDVGTGLSPNAGLKLHILHGFGRHAMKVGTGLSPNAGLKRLPLQGNFIGFGRRNRPKPERGIETIFIVGEPPFSM